MTDESKHPILKVDNPHLVEQYACLGLIPLQPTKESAPIQTSIEAVADGVLPPTPSWDEHGFATAIAVSYVHTDSQQWYGQVLRGKFSYDAKERVVAELLKRKSKGLWLDQCLAQRRGDGEAGWAVVGLLPYAAMPVLVVGNFAKLSVVIHAYLELGRFEQVVIEAFGSRLLKLIESVQKSIPGSSF